MADAKAYLTLSDRQKDNKLVNAGIAFEGESKKEILESENVPL